MNRIEFLLLIILLALAVNPITSVYSSKVMKNENQYHPWQIRKNESNFNFYGIPIGTPYFHEIPGYGNLILISTNLGLVAMSFNGRIIDFLPSALSNGGILSNYLSSLYAWPSGFTSFITGHNEGSSNIIALSDSGELVLLGLSEGSIELRRSINLGVIWPNYYLANYDGHRYLVVSGLSNDGYYYHLVNLTDLTELFTANITNIYRGIIGLGDIIGDKEPELMVVNEPATQIDLYNMFNLEFVKRIYLGITDFSWVNFLVGNFTSDSNLEILAIYSIAQRREFMIYLVDNSSIEYVSSLGMSSGNNDIELLIEAMKCDLDGDSVDDLLMLTDKRLIAFSIRENARTIS